MSFVSFAFLLLFCLVIGLRLSVGRRKTEAAYLGMLIVSSIAFYSWHVPVYLVLLVGSTLVDFFADAVEAR